MVRPAGKYLEDQGGCDEADYVSSGRATARTDRAGAAIFCARQPFIRRGRRGHRRPLGRRLGRAGAGRRGPQGVAAIVAFAPGRGGHANDFPNQVCAPHTLIAAAAAFGQGARVPVTWLVAANDTLFFARVCRGNWPTPSAAAAARSDFRVLAASGSEGHWLAETEGGVRTRRTRARSRAEAAATGRGEEAMTLYFLVKYLHVLGAIVILGTGTGIAFFMLMAHRSGDAAFIARTAATVVIADMLFTLVGGDPAARHRRPC